MRVIIIRPAEKGIMIINEGRMNRRRLFQVAMRVLLSILRSSGVKVIVMQIKY